LTSSSEKQPILREKSADFALNKGGRIFIGESFNIKDLVSEIKAKIEQEKALKQQFKIDEVDEEGGGGAAIS
jgi:hypothetical protein